MTWLGSVVYALPHEDWFSYWHDRWFGPIQGMVGDDHLSMLIIQYIYTMQCNWTLSPRRISPNYFLVFQRWQRCVAMAPCHSRQREGEKHKSLNRKHVEVLFEKQLFGDNYPEWQRIAGDKRHHGESPHSGQAICNAKISPVYVGYNLSRFFRQRDIPRSEPVGGESQAKNLATYQETGDPEWSCLPKFLVIRNS